MITIGNFDGVHVGHAELLRRGRAIADEAGDVRLIALVFDPHPASTLAPARVPPRLQTWEQKRESIIDRGADEVVRLDPTPDLLGMAPEDFLSDITARYGAVAFVEGEDFRFGRARAGDINLLRGFASSRGIRVEIVPPVEAALTDQTIARASSTTIRWLVERGRVTDAAILLGRPYAVRGEVERGDRRGRAIGFPTANINTRCLPPGDGVYAGTARLPDGSEHPAAIHVGKRETFDDHRRTIEAYLMDWPGLEAHDLPEYGWAIDLSFVAFARDQARFETVEGLVEQIERDVARCRELLADARFRSAWTGASEELVV